MTLKQGDIITHTDGSKRKILGVVGEVVIPSALDVFEKCAFPSTGAELLKMGYTFPKEKWTPEVGKVYFKIDISVYSDLCPTAATWTNHELDIARRDGTIGIFRTEAEAQDRIALIEAKLKEI